MIVGFFLTTEIFYETFPHNLFETISSTNLVSILSSFVSDLGAKLNVD